MNHSHPIVRAFLTFVGLAVLLVLYEFWFEPVYVDPTEDFAERLELVIVGLVCGLLALLAPTSLGLRDYRNRQAAEKRSEEALEAVSAVREGLADAIESISEAFVQFDGDGRLVRCNQRYRDLYRYTQEEARPGVTRQELGMIDRARGVIGDAEETERFLDKRRSQLTRGVSEVELQLADGRWLLSRSRPTKDGGVVSTQADITALKRAQAALRESENRLSDAIESLDAGFVYFDADDRLVIANSRYKEMYPAQKNVPPGTTYAEAVRATVEAGEIPVAIGQEEEWLERRIAQHREFSRVEEQHLADGRWVKVSERRTRDGGGVGIRTDITALKQSQIEAESANRAKTMFLAHMSHELRTPLNSIIGFSEIIRERMFGDHVDSYGEYADNIHHSGTLLLTLINNILDISKIEANELKPVPELVAVDDLVRDSLRLVRQKAQETDIALRAEGLDAGLTVYVDPLHFKQILLNLLSNGIKFTPRGGDVSVSCAALPPDHIEIEVSDTGIGIARKELSRVFEPFARIDNAMVRSREGTGLGLALVKSYVELNGGTVELTSARGKGTTVRVRLPGGTG